LTQAQLDALTAAKVPAASNTSPLTQAQLAALVAAGVPATTIKSAFTSPAKPTITLDINILQIHQQAVRFIRHNIMPAQNTVM